MSTTAQASLPTASVTPNNTGCLPRYVTVYTGNCKGPAPTPCAPSCNNQTPFTTGGFLYGCVNPTYEETVISN
jgi:hypothetical protein